MATLQRCAFLVLVLLWRWPVVQVLLLLLLPLLNSCADSCITTLQQSQQWRTVLTQGW
jgi:hypothetical protein